MTLSSTASIFPYHTEHQKISPENFYITYVQTAYSTGNSLTLIPCLLELSAQIELYVVHNKHTTIFTKLIRTCE